MIFFHLSSIGLLKDIVSKDFSITDFMNLDSSHHLLVVLSRIYDFAEFQDKGLGELPETTDMVCFTNLSY